MRRKYIGLILVLLLAVFLRFWQLGNNPPGLHADEALTGYTAYSLYMTGLDLHGNFRLLSLADTNIGGSYPPLYSYILIPFIKIFGLNLFVDRLPPTIFGVLSVLAVFHIVKKLLKSEKIALLTSLLFALNPWAIHISRQGLLESISVFFVLTGILFFVYFEKKSVFLIFSALFFGFSLYAYDAPRLFLIFLIPMIIILYKDKLLKIKKYSLTSLILLCVFYSLIFLNLIKGELNEYRRSSMLNFEQVSKVVDLERTMTKSPLWLSSFFHNKLTVSLNNTITNYFNSFSVNWFFVNGSGNLQQAVARHGEFYFFELPFFFIGIYLMFRDKRKIALFFLFWMFAGALPGGLSKGSYVYRSVHVLPIPIIFSSYGIIYFWTALKKRRVILRYTAKLLLTVISVMYISSYLFTYFYDYPIYASDRWAKEQNETIAYAISQKNSYSKIFIDGGEAWATQFAFHKILNPNIYQNAYKNKQVVNNTEVLVINNFYFGNYNFDKNKSLSYYFPKGSLLVTGNLDFPKDKLLKTFSKYKDIQVIFRVYEVM